MDNLDFFINTRCFNILKAIKELKTEDRYKNKISQHLGFKILVVIKYIDKLKEIGLAEEIKKGRIKYLKLTKFGDAILSNLANIEKLLKNDDGKSYNC